MFHDDKYICLTHTTQGVGESSQLACVKLALRFGSLVHSLFSIWRHKSWDQFRSLPGFQETMVLFRFCFAVLHLLQAIGNSQFSFVGEWISVWALTPFDPSSARAEPWSARTSSEVAPMGAASVPEARGTFSLLLFVFALVNENCGATRLFDISEIQFPNSKNDLNNVTNTIETEQNVS